MKLVDDIVIAFMRLLLYPVSFLPEPKKQVCGMCGIREKCCMMCDQCIGDGGQEHKSWCEFSVRRREDV